MKNIIYPFMTMVAAAAALVSCTREETEVNEQTEYVYRFELVEGETKATLDNEGVWWEADKDHVGVIVGDENIQADVVESEGKKVISFTSESAIEEGTPIYSYYPYSQAITSAAEAQVTIPTEQEGGSVSAMPMAGIPIHLESAPGATSNGTINFMNLGAIIEFRVYSTNADYANETVESVAFWSDSEEQKVSGTAPIDLTDVAGGDEPSAPTIVLGTPSYRRATVTQSATVAANKENATPIYLVVAPGTFASGKIVVNTNAASYTFTYTNKSFARNSIKKFSMNLGGSNVVRDAMTKTYTNIETNQLSEGTYLLVAYDNSSSGDGAGTYICWIPNTGNGSAHQDRQVISHIKYSANNESSVASDGLENRSGDIIGSEVIIEQYDNKWLVKVKKTGQYLYCPNENYKIGFTTDKSLAGHTWTLNGSNIYFDSGDYHFYHSGSEKGFSYRTTAESQYSYNVRFYKLSGSSKSQTIWFERPVDTVLDPDAVLTYDLASAEPFVAPVLKGAKTTVVYGTSNPAIASVDATTGAVTIPGTQRGTVTITATAAGMDGYASATASYKIDVTDSSIPASVYNKVTSVNDLETGAKYLLVFEGLAGDEDDGDPKVFSAVLNGDGSQFAKATTAALDVTIANGVIESSEFDDCQFTLESGYYLKGDQAKKYIYPGSSSGSSVMLAESTASHALTIAINNGIAEIANDGRYLVWSTSSHYFSCNAEVSGQYSTGICLYQLDDGRQAQTLVFSGSEAKYDLGTREWTVAVPTVTGNETSPLTWTSSDEAVATVDASGNVTPVAKGTAIITASAPANETYKSGSASFTVTVFNSNAPTYYKADEMQSGKVYLIVSNGYALRNNDGIAAEPVEITEGVIKYDAPSTDLWTATADGGAFTLTNNGQYLRRASGNVLQIGSKSGTDSYNRWTYDSVNDYLTITPNSLYYLYYNNGFAISTTAGNAALYSTEKPLVTQPMAFSGATAEYDLNEDVENHWVEACPTLSGNKTTPITYSIECTPEGVAAIDSQTGEVTPLTVGTAVITASVPADDTWKAASASYTLSVIDSSPQPRNLAFNPNEVTYNMGGSTPFAAPTLTGSLVDGDVKTYVSSNPSVATVVESTGEVTIVGVGTTTISVTVAANTGYLEGTASYTLTVENVQPKYYRKVTSSDEIVAGGEYLVVYVSDSKLFKPILNGTSFQTATSNAIDVTITNDAIESSEVVDACKIVLESATNGFYAYVPSAERYLYPNSSSIGAESSKNTVVSVSPTSIYRTISSTWSSSTYNLRYSGTNSYFQSSTNSANVTLFMYDDGQPKAQNLAFSPTSVSYNMFGSPTFTKPTLSGAKTTVTYNSSKPSVATVDASTGDVTFVGEGTTTITAIAEATEKYLEGSASYTIEVTNVDPSTYTYSLIAPGDFVSGGTYLIVSADSGNYNKMDKIAAFAGETDGSVVNVDGTSGTITGGDYTAYEYVITASGNSYTLKNGSNYLSGSSTSGDRYIQIGTTATTMSLAYKADLSDALVTDAFYFYYLKNSSKEVLYLNSDGKFKIGGSGRKYGVYLYKRN